MVPFMLDRFNKRGWEMELFSLPKRIRGKGTEEVRFSTFDWTVYAGNPIVDKYIQTYKDYVWWTKLRIQKSFDLIHAHHPIAGLVMKQVFPETPLIMTVHSSYEKELILNGKIAENGPEHAFLTSIYRELEERADQLITVSNSFKHYMADYLQEPERVGVIPNGFDEKRFRPVQHENKVPQLISVCRLVPAKGLDTLLYACAELKQKGHKFVLHLIGDGPIRQELEELAVKLDIYEETIFFTGIFYIRKISCRSLTCLCFRHAPNRSVPYLRKPRCADWPSSARMSEGSANRSNTAPTDCLCPLMTYRRWRPRWRRSSAIRCIDTSFRGSRWRRRLKRIP